MSKYGILSPNEIEIAAKLGALALYGNDTPQAVALAKPWASDPKSSAFEFVAAGRALCGYDAGFLSGIKASAQKADARSEKLVEDWKIGSRIQVSFPECWHQEGKIIAQEIRSIPSPGTQVLPNLQQIADAARELAFCDMRGVVNGFINNPAGNSYQREWATGVRFVLDGMESMRMGQMPVPNLPAKSSSDHPKRIRELEAECDSLKRLAHDRELKITILEKELRSLALDYLALQGQVSDLTVPSIPPTQTPIIQATAFVQERLSEVRAHEGTTNHKITLRVISEIHDPYQVKGSIEINCRDFEALEPFSEPGADFHIDISRADDGRSAKQ